MTESRLQSPAAQRNRDAILDVLRRVLPAEGLVLEVASGTGEHMAHFAAALPALSFQPSDPVPERRASIDAWCAGMANVRPALDIDVVSRPWPVARADAVVCANMIHIAPWAACEGLVLGASSLLLEPSLLVLYGPYRVSGRHIAQSNADFDADLRARNPEWGIRDLEMVTELAERSGFAAPDVVTMPANNLCLVFRRKG
jgi:hypothetical protein